MQCLPDSLKGKKYYYPTTSGSEKQFGEILKRIEQIRKKDSFKK